MALSDVDLRRQRGYLYTISPFDERLLTPLGYDVRPGFVITPDTAEVLYASDGTDPQHGSASFTIPAGRAVTVVTEERLYLTGKLIATLHGRSRITARGILTNPVTVDPNWNGRLILHFYNSSCEDVTVPTMAGIATLIVHSVKTKTKSKAARGATRELLREGEDRYSKKVRDEIITYLERFDDSADESQYDDDVERTSWYGRQPLAFRPFVWLWRRITRRDFGYYSKWATVFLPTVLALLTLVFTVLIWLGSS